VSQDAEEVQTDRCGRLNDNNRKDKVMGYFSYDLQPITLEHKDKIRLLLDKGWTSAQIQKRRYRKYTARQIGAVRGWMRRGKY